GVTFTDAYLPPNKATEYGFGEIVSVPGANTLTTSIPPTNIEGILAVIQFKESHSDGITKISQLGQGQSDPDADTATEVRALSAAQRSGINSFLSVVSQGVAEVYAYYAQRFALDIDKWGNHYADLVGIEDFKEYEALARPAVWKARVRSV